MKKILLGLGSFVLLGLVINWTVITYLPEKIVPFLLSRQVKTLSEPQDFMTDTEAITVFTLGTSSPLPGERAQTGTAVFVNGRFFMFDVGPGVVQKAENNRLPLSQLEGIFLTHWHSDHFFDLPYLISRSWVLGRTTDLHLYGPKGLDTLNQAIDQFLHIENQYRVAHHGTKWMDISKARGISHEFTDLPNGKKVVYEKDGIVITAFVVNHEPIEPAVGYAIAYKGKKVVISGDTKKNELVEIMAKDADLLLHEVLLASLLQQMATELTANGYDRNAALVTDIQDYHTSPAEVAELAAKANVKRLVLHHFVPVPDRKVIKNLYLKELKAYKGTIHFANDGDKFIVK